MGGTWLEMVRVGDTGVRGGRAKGGRWAVRPRGRRVVPGAGLLL